MTKWLNPDATQADLGEGMQAYYDEKRKVWVFPGEDPDEVAKPIGPPPITPMAATPTPAPLPAAIDPLAAMMAPPKRQPASFQAKSKSVGSTPTRPAIPGMMIPGVGSPAAASPAFVMFPVKQDATTKTE